MKVAVVGATGLVGTRMMEVLAERNFPVSEFFPVASERSVGKKVTFAGKTCEVISADEAIARKPDLAIFSAGGGVSRDLAPRFAEAGCRVVDNSSYWRMDPTKKLVVPEINADVLSADDYIIANPNCSTIQMLLPLAPLHKRFIIKRIVVSTYQAVTGSGQKGVVQLETERAGAPEWGTYPVCYNYPIDLNVIPHIDVFLENGNTKEEQKMIDETRKILRDNKIGVSATTARVPVTGGHSESVNLEFEKPFELDEIRDLWARTPGLVVCDDPSRNVYPMPIHAFGRDEVFVGRLRRDSSVESGINFWCVADNVRKGAATNAVQIAEVLVDRGFLPRY